MKIALPSLIAVPFLFLTTACNASRVSGTYVAHATTFTEMLQLTQAPDGQINGVLSHVELKSDGRISSEQTPVSGTADGGQITLKFPGIPTFISGSSLAGTIGWSSIHLQVVDTKGNVSSEEFDRSNSDKFKAYVDELKTKGHSVACSTNLRNLAKQYRETVSNAEGWIANAQLHAHRIPNARRQYDQIKDAMESLLDRERHTLDSNIRAQIALKIEQGDLAGEQLDVQLDQIWDMGIDEPGARLKREFSGWDGNCGKGAQLRKQGADDEAINAWDEACQQVVAERTKFEPLYKQIAAQSADVKSLEATSRSTAKLC
jgi:hypothetical protein